MTFQEFKEIAVAQAKALGIAEYEFYYQSGESTSVDVFQHEVNEFSASMEGGVCFRCIVGGKMGYASTEELSEVQAKAVVTRAMENAAVLESEEAVFLAEGGKTYEPLTLKGYELPSTEALIQKVLETQEKLYAADEKIIDGCQTSGFCQSMKIAISNSKGLDLEYENKASGLVAAAVVSDGTVMEDDYQIKLGKLANCIIRYSKKSFKRYNM